MHKLNKYVTATTNYFRNKNTSERWELSASEREHKIDSQEKLFILRFRHDSKAQYNGNLCLWQPIHNKRIPSIIVFLDVVLRHIQK